MKKDRQLISIIVPMYNESEGVALLYKALKKVTRELQVRVELVFVDDGSEDGTIDQLQRLATKDKAVHAIELSRNFGKEIAVSAGLQAAKGAAAIIMDADLQHPPELIPEFIAKWKAGADVVVGVRQSYGREAFHKRFNSWLFYKFINGLAEIKVVPHSTDFRLLDRVVVNEFLRFTERNRITRGLIDWLGFRREYVYFTAGERAAGSASYSFPKLIRLAVNSFVGLSLIPLKLAGYLGIGITVISALLGLGIVIEKYIFHEPASYSVSTKFILLDFNTFLIGIVLMCLGLVALYVANIHGEVINRPLYAIRREYGSKDPTEEVA